MSKKEKKVQMNQNLLNLKMEKKFKKAFSAITVGMVALELIGLIIILMLNVSLGAARTPAILTRSIIAAVLLVVVLLVNLSLCRVVSKSLSTAIVVPVQEIRDAVGKLKAGDFDIDITYEGKDELGELGADLLDTCAELKAVVNDAGYMLGEMAEGHFNVTSDMEESYVGDFQTLIQGMNKLNRQMNNTLHRIREASEQVMSGSEQLADSAQELADGATNQAGAVEELTATIENVSNISEETADNAVNAATNIKEAALDAEKSREGINQLTEAMERITQTSQEIENIIAAIEDIASQTNLLSLNASIEAARAGEAGRGFAVVADQIGKLAADSAQSAVTTRELISKSLTEIEIGNQIVEHTMESIGTVLENMSSFADMAAGSAEASKSQAEMLKQIEAGIDQISSVVQNNSAAAEETSAVSEELSAQSVTLKEMIASFVLGDAE